MNRCAYIFLDEAGNFDFSRVSAIHGPKVFSGNGLMGFRRPATILPRRERIT